LAAAVVFLTVLGLGVYGMGRSLWLDEAWVANSLQEHSLAGMFYYPGSLQTSPPLFLLLARAAVRLAGASNFAFRLVPLLLAMVAAAGTLAVSARVLRMPFALLATALVVFDPTAIEYSRTLKPYSGELAASAFLLLATVCYLQSPDGRRFGWLLITAAVAMPLAYSAVFLMPGIVIAVAATRPLARAATLAAVSSGILLAMYLLTIRPNLGPELHAFWAFDADHERNAGLLAALLFSIAVAIHAAVAIARGPAAYHEQGAPRDWTYILCAAPCLLLALSGAMGWYPVSHRTRLFALPCFWLLAAMTAEDGLKRFHYRKLVPVIAVSLTLGLAGSAVANQVIEGRATAEEDFAGAVAFLQQHAAPSDLLLVHACCKEGFELYAGMDAWTPPHVLFGDTGWPCCARGKDARPGKSTEQALVEDLDAKIPPRYSGRIWLLFTTRPTHWTYVGLNEGDLWRKHVWQRGCPPGPYLRFANLAVSPMNCVAESAK
jgi:hypothetical protein